LKARCNASTPLSEGVSLASARQGVAAIGNATTDRLTKP